MSCTQIEITFKIVGIVGGLLTAFKILYEMQQGRKQKEKDLRWKQAKSAQELINQLVNDEYANNATVMFDWEDREFEIEPGLKDTISFDDVKNSLRITNLEFNDKEIFIRDCVDGFLFQVEFMEQSIQNGLIEFKDLRFPMEYYIKTINENKILAPLKGFIRYYHYKNSEKFIQRFGY